MSEKKCIICGAAFDVKNKSPFCSERCKSIDLNRWLSDQYLIKGDEYSLESEIHDNF